MFVYAADHASTSVISARMTVYTTVCTVVYLSVFCRKGILEMARMSHRGHSFIMDGRLFMRKKKKEKKLGPATDGNNLPLDVCIPTKPPTITGSSVLDMTQAQHRPEERK